MVGTKGTGQFFVCFIPPRILDNTFINLQKGRKTFSRKIPASYKYFKTVKIAVYVLNTLKLSGFSGNIKRKKIKVEYLR